MSQLPDRSPLTPQSTGTERRSRRSATLLRGPLRLYPALGHARFRALWLGMLPASLAWFMGMVATPYAAFSLTGSATILGLVSLAMGLPMMLLSLVGGVVADRASRRWVLIWTQSTLGGTALLIGLMVWTGNLDLWVLLVAGFVQGTALAFNMPARQAYLAEVAGRDLLRNAVALNNAGLSFSRVAGPALTGALLATPTVGLGGVFVLMAVMYAAVLTMLVGIHDPVIEQSEKRIVPGTAQGGWAQLVEGLRYVRGSPVLLTLLGMNFGILFLGLSYQTFLPVFAEQVYAVGPSGLGMLATVPGFGAVVGSLVAAGLATSRHSPALQLGAGACLGLALIGFGLSPTFPLALATLAVVGFASSAYATLNNTLISSNVETRLFGRVMSVHLLTFAAAPLGALPLGWIADQLGAPIAMVVAGAGISALVMAVAFFYPSFGRAPRTPSS